MLNLKNKELPKNKYHCWYLNMRLQYKPAPIPSTEMEYCQEKFYEHLTVAIALSLVGRDYDQTKRIKMYFV